VTEIVTAPDIPNNPMELPRRQPPVVARQIYPLRFSYRVVKGLCYELTGIPPFHVDDSIESWAAGSLSLTRGEGLQSRVPPVDIRDSAAAFGPTADGNTTVEESAKCGS
jgi:hypothetical protein